MRKDRYPFWGYAKNCLKWRNRSNSRLSEHEKIAVDKALEDIDRLPDARERRIIVDEVFFKNAMTLEGAAMKANVSYATARRYHQHAIKQVAYHLGLLQE